MDGITTCATRLITKEIFEKYGNPNDDLTLRTEFMNVEGFLINPENVINHLQTTPDQKPIAQIYGGNETTLIQAAVNIENDYSDLFS
ncbi:MAG: hypothetical protein LBG59_09575 [Candidatus Peribacteria bacterium]|jgi:tRNA-dihydrouridine synthase|nr:hypothetical protein [Candidatus Peribacteria bacterium]